MKKLLGIVVLGLLISTNSFTDIISLKCQNPNGSFSSLELDTNTKKAKFKGITINRYIKDKDEFKFLFNIREYDYRASLNIFSGVLLLETFFVSKEEKTEMIANVMSKIIDEKKDGDKYYLIKNLYTEYDNKDRYILDKAECEKVMKKF